MVPEVSMKRLVSSKKENVNGFNRTCSQGTGLDLLNEESDMF